MIVVDCLWDRIQYLIKGIADGDVTGFTIFRVLGFKHDQTIFQINLTPCQIYDLSTPHACKIACRKDRLGMENFSSILEMIHQYKFAPVLLFKNYSE
jgi:hypothetical protein